MNSKGTKSALKTPRFWLGVSFFVLVIVGIVLATGAFNDWLQDEQQLPVQRIVVSGQTMYLRDEQVEQAIRLDQPGSFFELDVNSALLAVEALPWVQKASIRKEWPSTLRVYVIEQQPVARWNDDMLLSRHGELFQSDAAGDALALPLLFGPGGSEQTALQGFYAMQGLLDNSQLQIEELFLTERYAWQIKLHNGIRLNIGRQEFIDRVQRFVDLYPLLAKDSRDVEYIDLRYDTGLAVGWKSES